MALTKCYSTILCNLSDSETSVSANDFSHTCHSLLGVGGGRPVWAGVVFKGSASTFETGVPLKCLQSSCLQHFICFSTSFPQTETETDAHTLLNLLLHREM